MAVFDEYAEMDVDRVLSKRHMVEHARHDRRGKSYAIVDTTSDKFEWESPSLLSVD